MQRINDGAGGSHTTDLKEQGTGSNYTYDLIGNLTRDSTNNVKNIDWTVYGKIGDLIHTAGGSVVYMYDAAGNRITKKASGTTTVYVRDAEGNVLSIYNLLGSGSPTQKGSRPLWQQPLGFRRPSNGGPVDRCHRHRLWPGDAQHLHPRREVLRTLQPPGKYLDHDHR